MGRMRKAKSGVEAQGEKQSYYDAGDQQYRSGFSTAPAPTPWRSDVTYYTDGDGTVVKVWRGSFPHLIYYVKSSLLGTIYELSGSEKYLGMVYLNGQKLARQIGQTGRTTSSNTTTKNPVTGALQ
jgi:hypothetical protein